MVKILAIGDMHGVLPKNLNGIVKRNKIDLIVCVGEIPPVPFQIYYPKNMRKNFDPSYADKKYDILLKKLCSFELPVMVLKGNAYMSLRGNKITKTLFGKYENLIYKRVGNVSLLKRILFYLI